MVKNNLSLLDCDEGTGLRTYFERIHADLLTAAKKYDFIVDLGVSDVVIYVRNKKGEEFALAW